MILTSWWMRWCGRYWRWSASHRRHITAWDERRGRNLVFYADDGSIAGRDHEWVKETLTVMVAIFCKMGPKANINKTKAMVCTPRFIWGKRGELAYKRQTTGEGATLRERKKTRVCFNVCGVTVVESYLQTHMAQIHGICVPQMRGFDEVGGGPTTYVLPFPRVLQELKCPLPGCLAVAYRPTWTGERR